MTFSIVGREMKPNRKAQGFVTIDNYLNRVMLISGRKRSLNLFVVG